MFSPQLRDEPCVTADAAVWARDTYAEYGVSSLTSLHAWDYPVAQSLNVLSGLVIRVAMQRRLLCVTGGDTCRKVVCHTLLPSAQP